MDAQLASQSRSEAALRLRLGQALEVLGRGACFELGFSSLTAYALERCERSTRWVEEARCLSRRLEALPVLRRAVAFGAVSWSKAVLIARVAVPSDEAQWAEVARHLTVRQLAARLSAEVRPPSDRPSSGRPPRDTAQCADPSDEVCTLVCTVDREEAWLFEATRALLTQLGTSSSNDQIEALLAEAQINLLDALPRGTLELEAECALDTAQARWREQLARWRDEAEVRCEASILRRHAEESRMQAHREEELGRASATQLCIAPRGAERLDGCEPFDSTLLAAASGCSTLESLSPHQLDGTVRRLSRWLAEHELTMSRLMLAFHRADGWRRTGFATETQYARERLGISRSALLGRRSLALQLESLPHVAEALSHSRIGVEAALQLVRIATPETELAWIERAQQRTIKHLREEVNAALTAVRITGDPACPPPTEAEVDTFHELERAASSGRIFGPMHARESYENEDSAGATPRDDRRHARQCEVDATGLDRRDSHVLGATPRGSSGEPAHTEPSAWHVTLASLARWLGVGFQMSAGHTETTAGVQTSAGQGTGEVPVSAASPAARGSHGSRHCGRVVLRLRISRGTYGWWRSLEKQARRWLPAGVSWLRFCCVSLWRAWQHLLGPQGAFGHIYIRDRQRCTSPVCTRRDVTPHHIHFRSAGGSDEDENVAAVCTWCHLSGIHGGRIRAKGSASHIHWELGRGNAPHMVVDGRERRAA